MRLCYLRHSERLEGVEESLAAERKEIPRPHSVVLRSARNDDCSKVSFVVLGFAEAGSRRSYTPGHFFLAIDIEHFLNLRRELQIMRDESGSTGYEAYF
jgi:hypothetical protein